MAESSSPDSKASPRRKRSRLRLWMVCLIALGGIAVVAWECYTTMPIVRVGTVNMLAWFGTRTLPMIRGYLEDEDVEVEAAAGAALRAAGGNAVPVMRVWLEDSDANRRLSAVAVLGGMGADALPALPKLIEMSADDGSDGVRRGAVRALPNLGLGPDVIKAVCAAIHDRAEEVRFEAVCTLEQTARKVRDAWSSITITGALVEALTSDAAANNRVRSAEVLGTLGADWRSVHGLMRALEDPVLKVRLESAESLGNFGPEARDAVPALIKLLSDPVPQARNEAAEALGKIGPDAHAAVDSLRKAMLDPLVEREAKKALSSIER